MTTGDCNFVVFYIHHMLIRKMERRMQANVHPYCEILIVLWYSIVTGGNLFEGKQKIQSAKKAVNNNYTNWKTNSYMSRLAVHLLL